MCSRFSALLGGVHMRAGLSGCAVIALIAGTVPAAAQGRSPVPNTGMWSVGGSIGAGSPRDASLSGGFDIAGNLERYLTPRVSVRGQLGGSWNDIVQRNF